MSVTTDYQQGFYDGVDKVRKILQDDAEDNFLPREADAYRMLILREISDLLHEPPAI